MRARNMQALTDAIKRKWPGVTVYGIGDAAHQTAPSDHNEDDTTGSWSEQTDADSNPEHRALDVMLGPALSEADAYALVNALVTDPASRRRLRYVIFDGWIWQASNGWAKQVFWGDPHSDHPHISGLAADDENGAGWPAIDAIGQQEEDMPLTKTDVDAIWAKKFAEYVDENGNKVRDARTVGDLLAATHRAALAAANPVLIVQGVLAGLAELPSGAPVTDEQLERVLRKVLGSVDGSPPPAPPVP